MDTPTQADPAQDVEAGTPPPDAAAAPPAEDGNSTAPTQRSEGEEDSDEEDDSGGEETSDGEDASDEEDGDALGPRAPETPKLGVGFYALFALALVMGAVVNDFLPDALVPEGMEHTLSHTSPIIRKVALVVAIGTAVGFAAMGARALLAAPPAPKAKVN